jgi:glyoxylase-like metal-dependent hydrolase (beta-lactamase superfamily II)
MLRSRMIGAFKVSSLIEYYGPTHIPEIAFTQFDRSCLAEHHSWLTPQHYVPESDRLVIAVQLWMVQTGSDVILIDAGVGNGKRRPIERMNMLNTLVLQWMAAAGAPPEKITHVVMTHLHSDHVGWNTIMVDGRWVPTFPNARYLVPKENYDQWQHLIQGGQNPDNGSFADSVLPLVDAGVVEFIENQKQVAGCLEVEAASGHTPGHLTFRLRSEGQEGLFAGDVLHHPFQVVRPDSNSAFDFFPDVARRTRAAVLASAAASGALVMPCHFGPPCCGYIRKQAGAYRFEPGTW